MLTLTDKKTAVRPVQTGSNVVPYVAPPTALPTPALTIEDIWRRLWRNKWIFLVTALSVMLVTAYMTWTTVPTYRAGATIQIEKDGVKVVNFGTVDANGPNLGVDDPFFRTQYEQLKSRKLAEIVIKNLNLQQRLFARPVEIGFFDTLMHLAFGKKNETTDAKQDIAQNEVNAFISGLYVEPVERTHLVKIYYESPDPVLSADIVNALIDAYIKDSINNQTATDSYAKTVLDSELEKARDRLTMQEAKLVEYAKQNNILEVNNSQATQEKKLEDLNGALAQAERSRIQAESVMSQGQKHGNVKDVLTNPVVEGIKKNLVELEAEYQEKLKIFKPAYPDMQLLDQQIREMRRQLQSEMGGLKQSLQADYTSAKKLEDDLRIQLDQYKQELVDQRDRSIEYNALKREVETSRNLYDGLLQRMKEVSVASNVTSSNIKIVDAAVPPPDMFRPKKSLNMIIGVLAGVLLGIGAALLRETLRQSITSVGELQALSGLPVLGTVPHVRNMAEPNLAMAAIRDMGSSFAEAYRVAAANLRFVLPGGHAPRITLITSVNPAEGKSTSAVNIALSQAQQGLKVLLIDADLRKPTIHFKMGLSNQKGLSNFLTGEVDIASVTQASRDAKGLYIVTAGVIVSDPVKLLAGNTMAQLLNLALQHFDSVIIDAPPVVGFADTLYLSSMAQATLLVADEDRINRKRLLNAIEQLQRIKPNLVGFLMVKSQQPMTDYRYYEQQHEYNKTAEQKANAKTKRRGLNLVPVSS